MRNSRRQESLQSHLPYIPRLTRSWAKLNLSRQKTSKEVFCTKSWVCKDNPKGRPAQNGQSSFLCWKMESQIHWISQGFQRNPVQEKLCFSSHRMTEVVRFQWILDKTASDKTAFQKLGIWTYGTLSKAASPFQSTLWFPDVNLKGNFFLNKRHFFSSR